MSLIKRALTKKPVPVSSNNPIVNLGVPTHEDHNARTPTKVLASSTVPSWPVAHNIQETSILATFFGAIGTGKSRALAQVAQAGERLAVVHMGIGGEGVSQTARSYAERTEHDKKTQSLILDNIRVVTLSNIEEIEALVSSSGVEILTKTLFPDWDFTTLVFEEIHQTQVWGTKKLLGKAWTFEREGGDAYEHWDKVRTQTEDTLRGLFALGKRLNVHMIMTSYVKEREVPGSPGNKKLVPSFSGSAIESFMGSTSFNLHFEKLSAGIGRKTDEYVYNVDKWRGEDPPSRLHANMYMLWRYWQNQIPYKEYKELVYEKKGGISQA